MKQILTGIICGYLGAGLFAGLLMQQAIPALNTLGVSYIATTWPKVIYCARTERACDPLPPEWLREFIFD